MSVSLTWLCSQLHRHDGVWVFLPASVPSVCGHTYISPVGLTAPQGPCGGARVAGRALLAQQQQEDMLALVSTEGLTLIPSSPIPSCHPKGNSGACAASTWKSCRSSSISTPSWSRLPSLHSIRNSSALMLSPLRGQPSDLEERQLYFLQPDGLSPWTPFPQPPPSCALWRVVSLGVSKH